MLDNPPKGCESVAALASWSQNYDHTASPWLVFLDLIGYTAEHFGESLGKQGLELDYLTIENFAGALVEYSNRPLEVEQWILDLECANV